MANGVNKTIVIGNLVRDGELTHVGENETPKCTFRLLVTTRKGQDGEHTEGFNCAVWGKRAEGLVQHLTKGKRLYVEGEMRTRSYEGEDGEKRYFTELHVRELVFQPQPRRSDESAPDAPSEVEGEIPY